MRVDTEKIEMRDADNATRVRTTKEGETFLDEKERAVTIMGSEGVDVIEKAEEDVVKFNLTVPADMDIETTKKKVATMLMVAERDVEVKERPSGAGRRLSEGAVERSVTVRPPADKSVETIKTALESKTEADVRVALGSDQITFDNTAVKVETEATKPANATKPSIRAVEEKPDGTRKEVTKIDDEGVTVVASDASATKKPSIRTVEEKEDDGELLEVATMDVDGVKVAVRPGMTTKPAIRSVEEKPDGETVERFRADNNGTEVRDENNKARVKTTKDGEHVKDADGFDTAVIDSDGVAVIETPSGRSHPSIRSVDTSGVERFKADKEGSVIRDAQNKTRMRADQDGTSFMDSDGKSAVDITDGGILLNDRLETDGNSTRESAIRMLSSNGTVRAKVDTSGYDLRNAEGYTSVKLYGAGAGNYTTAMKIFDPETGAPRFEAGADLGLRINDKNGTTRSRVHEGVNIYDANSTDSSKAGQVAVALGSAGLLTYASDGDISLMMKRSGEIESVKEAKMSVARSQLQTNARAEIATHDAYDPEDELKEEGLYRRPGLKAEADEADVVRPGDKAPETYEREDDGRTVMDREEREQRQQEEAERQQQAGGQQATSNSPPRGR